MMQVQQHIPKYPLCNFIQHIVYVSGALPIRYLRELPQGGVNLVIELNENIVNTVYLEILSGSKKAVKNAWISGTQKQAIMYKNNPNSTIMGVRFTAGGFFSLTRIPVAVLDEVGIEAEEVFGSSFMRLHEQLLNASSFAERVDFIERYFLQYSVEENMGDHIVKFINQHLDKPLDWLIQKSGYSQKHVIHLLKTYTGFSPKYLQRIHRLNQVVTEIQKNKDHIDWFAIIHRYGYFDQAHFIKDFSHFTGLKPTEYLGSQLALDANRLVPDVILQIPDDGATE